MTSMTLPSGLVFQRQADAVTKSPRPARMTQPVFIYDVVSPWNGSTVFLHQWWAVEDTKGSGSK